MPFISNEEIQSEVHKKQIREKIEAKKETNLINEKAREKPEEPKNKITELDWAKIKQAPKQKPISVNDIKNELKLQQLILEEHEKEIERIDNDVELSEIKNEVIGLLSIPHKRNPEKQLIFHKLLQNSHTVNNYVDSNVMYRVFNRANQHLKFGVVYGMKYLQANQIYELRRCQPPTKTPAAPTTQPENQESKPE